MDWNNECTDYSVTLYRQRMAKMSNQRKKIPMELGSMARKRQNAEQERTAMFYSSVAIRNSLKAWSSFVEAQANSSRISLFRVLVPRADGQS